MSLFLRAPLTHMSVDNLLWVLGEAGTEVGQEQLSALKELCLVQEGHMSKQ